MALATVDDAGNADLSPKGDPAGALARVQGDAVLFADRPGNRRVDSFRNIISQPRVAAVFLIPGAREVAALTGRAALKDDLGVREGFAVRGKTPTLATRVDRIEMGVRTSPALERAKLWPLDSRAEGIDPAAMFVAHMRANKDRGLGARIAGAVVSIPGVMQKGLDRDYKTNLY